MRDATARNTATRNTAAKDAKDTAQSTVMQRDNERRRLTVEGRRTDDGTRCTLLMVQETRGTWAFYPHGVAKLGVRITEADAATLATALESDE